MQQQSVPTSKNILSSSYGFPSLPFKEMKSIFYAQTCTGESKTTSISSRETADKQKTSVTCQQWPPQISLPNSFHHGCLLVYNKTSYLQSPWDILPFCRSRPVLSDAVRGRFVRQTIKISHRSTFSQITCSVHLKKSKQAKLENQLKPFFFTSPDCTASQGGTASRPGLTRIAR